MGSLAKPLEEIKTHYDVVVVGSGYGGAVAASRLARAGRRVCVLERGREFRTGEFKSTLRHMYNETQLTGRRLRRGSRAALYDFRIGKDLHVLTGCGLGGGSLINAAVALRPDATEFQRGKWPASVAGDGLLAPAFERAERMLGVATLPGANAFAKFRALQRGGDMLGASVEVVPTTINYRPGTNRANVAQYGCKLCGDCWSGCNVGAKNTLPLTYLPDAQHFGAEIFTLANVRHIGKRGNEWEIRPGKIRCSGDAAMLRCPRLIHNWCGAACVRRPADVSWPERERPLGAGRGIGSTVFERGGADAVQDALPAYRDRQFLCCGRPAACHRLSDQVRPALNLSLAVLFGWGAGLRRFTRHALGRESSDQPASRLSADADAGRRGGARLGQDGTPHGWRLAGIGR